MKYSYIIRKLFYFHLFILVFSNELIADDNTTDHHFSFHGYARVGLLTNAKGHKASEFKAPGAGAKYRLGNESDVQLRLRLNYLYGSKDSSKPYFKTVVAIEDYQRLGNSREFRINQVPKAWLEFGNYFGNGISFWAGRRWYERRGFYLNDYWWLNSGQKSHIGMGVEGINTGASELKVALFSHRDKNVVGVGASSNNKGTVKSSTLDIRLQDIAISDSSNLNFWGIYANREKLEDLNYDRKNGWGIGGWWDTLDVMGGTNTLAMTYRAGAAMHQNTYNARPIIESKGYNLKDAYQWEINNSWLWDDRTDYAVQWVAIIRQENFGVDGVNGDSIIWYSAGARPIFYLSKYWSIASDIGVDYVDNEIKSVKGCVNKASIALQLSTDTGFMSRPSLRLFVSVAQWSDDLIGHVGHGPDKTFFSDKDYGWSFGVQIEHIW